MTRRGGTLSNHVDRWRHEDILTETGIRTDTHAIRQDMTDKWRNTI